MKDLVIMKDQQAVTTSLQVAEGFGKRHTHVIEAIENKIHSAENSAQYENMFAEGSYQDRSGKSNKMYYMNRDGFTFIAFGFTGAKADEFKLQYIQAFNEMESYIKETQVKIPQTPMEALQLMFDAQKEIDSKVSKVDERVTDLEENAPLAPGEYSYIGKRVSQRVYEVARNFGTITSKQRGELFKDINQGIKQITGIATRTQLRKNQFETVREFINNWEPSTATKVIVNQMALDLEDETEVQS